MATQKDVVEMLVKYLASLSELLQKWNLWGIDLTKILHVLHQVRKDDLIGLSDGTCEIRKVYVSKQEQKKPEFRMLIDLGELTVPEGFVDKRCIKMFRKKYDGEVHLGSVFSDNIALIKLSEIRLKAGDKFHVIIYEFISPFLSISSDEIRSFLQGENSLLLDIRGIILVYDQKKDLIPKSEDYYYSFSRRNYLPIWLNFQGGKHVVSSNSIDGKYRKGTVFFAFIPIKKG